MNNRRLVLGSLLAGVLSVGATAPVAMRVELEPRRQAGDLTEVAVVVQVSPEDRIRIGENAIVRIELDGGTVSSGSPMRAVRLGDDGSTRITVEWPPGEHHLRVEIEDPSKEDTGLWVGTVRIPDLGRDAADREIDEPQPVPVPEEPVPEPVPEPEPEELEPVAPPSTETEGAIDVALAGAAALTDVEPPAPEPEPAPAPAPEPESPEPVAPPVTDTEDAIDAAEAAAAASTLAVPPTSEPPAEFDPDPRETEPEPESPEPVVPPVAETEDAIDAPVAAAAESTVVEPPVPAFESASAPESDPIEPAPESAPVSDPIEPEPAPVPVPEPEEPEPETPLVTETEVEEEPPLVEPLRADPPPETAEPKAVPPHQETKIATAPVPADLAARYEEWGSAGPDIREFSMIVTRGREPAKDVDVSTFRLRVGGSEVPVERLGDAEHAPLLLGLAIDVAADEVEDWSGMRGSLSPIVGRAGGGRGRLFVATADGIGGWDADMDAPGGVTLEQTSENVAELVIASIERFRGLRGRTFLVVLTDGRIEPTKEEWQEATQAAGGAGVPILVIALWDDQFNNRIRKNLKKLTEVSGGSLFLVQGRAQLESAADRFGRYLDGGFSLRFRSPGGDRQAVTSISVSSSDKELDVSAPKTIR